MTYPLSGATVSLLGFALMSVQRDLAEPLTGSRGTPTGSAALGAVLVSEEGPLSADSERLRQRALIGSTH